MKVRAYIKVGKTRAGARKPFIVEASSTAHHAPIKTGAGARRREVPTVSFAVDFVIPDKKFKEAEQVIAEIEIPEDQVEIEANVRQLD